MRTASKYVVTTWNDHGKPWTDYVVGKEQAIQMVRERVEDRGVTLVVMAKVKE